MRLAALTLLVMFAVGAGAVIVVRTVPNILKRANISADDTASLAFQPHPGARLPLATKLVDESGRNVALE